MQYHMDYREGIKAWLAGDKERACKHFAKVHAGLTPAEKAAREGLRVWCESKGAGKESELFELLARATLLGYVDLYVIVVLGLVAAEWSQHELLPIQKIALAGAAVQALRLGSELSGPIKQRLREVENEILSYRRDVTDNYLRCLQRKCPAEAAKYDVLLNSAVRLREGKLEGSIAVAMLLCLGEESVPMVPECVAVAADGL